MPALLMPAPCGGRGVCGSCGVRVISGELAEPDEQESAGLRHAPAGVRLACRARVDRGRARSGRSLRSPLETGTGLGWRRSRPLVAGVDLGTTSVAALLVDARSGREVARASVPNRQQTLRRRRAHSDQRGARRFG